MSKGHGQIFNPVDRAIYRAEGLSQIAFEALAADDNFHLTTTNPATGATTISVATDGWTINTCPGWPAAVQFTYTELSGSAVTAAVMVLKGIDQFGDYVTDTITAAFVSGTGWVGEGVVAFRKLLTAVVTLTGTTDVGDILIVGYNKKYGLGRKVGVAADLILNWFDGSDDAGTLNIPNSTFDVAGTPDGAKELLFLVHPGYYSGKQ